MLQKWWELHEYIVNVIFYIFVTHNYDHPNIFYY